MRKYRYTAVDVENKRHSGYYVADNPDDLRRQLSNSGLYLVKYKQAEGTGLTKAVTLSGKLPMKDLTVFCRQFAIMINAGIPIVDCILSLKDQKFNAATKQSLEQIYDDLNSGIMLSEAMRKQKKAYPEFFISMIYVGENSGTLDEILNHLANYYENDDEIRRRTRSALIYPVLLIVLAIGVVILLVTYIIPTFKSALSEMNVEMPALTMAIFNASEWLISHIKLIGIIAGAIIVSIFIFSRLKVGQYFFAYFNYNIFVTKLIIRKSTTSRFARALGLLLAGGTGMLSSLNMIKRILGNKYAEKKFGEVIKDIENGVSVTVALEKSKLFDKMLIQMVDVGEKSGALDDVLLSSCKFFDSQVDAAIKAVTSMIQPAILIVLAVIIAVTFIAMYSPILAVMDQLI